MRLFHDMTEDPPIVIFHSGMPKVYVFAGTTKLLLGSLNDFRPFRQLSNIWYVVDSPPNPAVQSNSYISITPGPGPTMLLEKLCI